MPDNDEPYQVLTFDFERDAQFDEDSSVSVTRTLEGSRSDILPVILREFGLFLQQLGFTYVREITAECDGLTHTSNRI